MSKARLLEGSITNLNLHAQNLDALLICTLSSRRYERCILAKAIICNFGPAERGSCIRGFSLFREQTRLVYIYYV